MRVAAFDIGIKNLAYCILENTDATATAAATVRALENANIMPEEPAAATCIRCKARASFQSADGLTCKRHATKPIHDGAVTLPALKEVIKSAGLPKATTKAAALESVMSAYSLPYKAPKKASAAKMSLDEIHDGIRKFVADRWTLLGQCDHILLENQPAFKNPHMKSVQILLYATLREAALRESRKIQFHLVHAKKKVADAAAGDAGYAERKSKSEDRVRELFASGGIRGEEALAIWTAAKKKSDMADAVCMCADFASTSAATAAATAST